MNVASINQKAHEKTFVFSHAPSLEHVSPTHVEYAALNDYDERKAGLLRIVRQLYSD